MTHSHGSAAGLRRRLAELRGGPDVPPRPLDARALAALAANPGCHRRALLDGAGVDKGALAQALGAPAPFGQSQFAFARGNSFEAKVKADGGAELIRLLCACTGETPPEPDEVAVPDLSADGPGGPNRPYAPGACPATGEAAGAWSLLYHPMLALDVAGSTAYLEPDAIAVHPDGSWTVIEIKSFPILDGSADAAKVGRRRPPSRGLRARVGAAEGSGAACASRRCWSARRTSPTSHRPRHRHPQAARHDPPSTRPSHTGGGNRRRPPGGTVFDPRRPVAGADRGGGSVPAAYAPECLASCELAFHCRARARDEGKVESLGRSVRGELGGLGTIEAVLAAARTGPPGEPRADPPATARRSGRGDACAARPGCAPKRWKPRRDDGPRAEAVSLMSALARMEAAAAGRAQPRTTVRHRHLPNARWSSSR